MFVDGGHQPANNAHMLEMQRQADRLSDFASTLMGGRLQELEPAKLKICADIISNISNTADEAEEIYWHQRHDPIHDTNMESCSNQVIGVVDCDVWSCATGQCVS